jgi:hypothetical protein
MERSMADSIDTTNLPITRQVLEAQISLLIDLLDQIDGDSDIEPDPDLEDGSDDEPSLGWSAGFMPELQRQEGRGFYMNADGGHDLEDEHDGREPSEDPEPDVDAEHSLGWGTGDSQTGQWTIVTDLEGGAGAVRKKRPASKTGGKVYRGCAILI